MRPADTELLVGLHPEVVRRVRRRFETLRIPARGHVFQRGDPGEVLVVVLDGSFVWEVDAELLPVLPGEVVGLTSFLTGEPYTGRLSTPSGGLLGLLHRERLDTLWARYPFLAIDFELRLGELLVASLRRQNERLVAALHQPLHSVPDAVRNLLQP